MPDFRQRLGWLPRHVRELAEERPIWVHAVSVGEAKAARPLIDALAARVPTRPILVSTVTPTGQAVAASLPGVRATFYLPFDTVGCVRAVLRQVRPTLLVVVETELWPALLRETVRARVPVAIVNGRLSDRSYPRYRQLRPFLAPLLSSINLIAARSDQDAQRLAACGALHVVVGGNLKYDALPSPLPPEQVQDLRQVWRLTKEEPVCVAGSTFPGEERLIADAWKKACPAGRLIVAPRHLHRVVEIERELPGAVRRSRLPLLPGDQRPSVMILDQMGLLAETYAVATVAVVGKSFYEKEGQNPLEPAALGIPAVFGPGMSNFQDDVSCLLAAGGALQTTAESLSDCLAELVRHPERRHLAGEAARQAIAARQGVAVNLAQKLQLLLTTEENT